MDGKINEYYKCPTCVYLVKLHDEVYCCESVNHPILLTSKQQCRKCKKWSSYDFDKFYRFDLADVIDDQMFRMTKKQIEKIWLDGRESGRREFLCSNRF